MLGGIPVFILQVFISLTEAIYLEMLDSTFVSLCYNILVKHYVYGYIRDMI